MINEEKLINLLFEGNESLVVKNGERFHLEDYIEYFNKPGLIVATIKGDSELGVQQLPIGAVDSFRFMQITNEDAIINQAKNNGKSYDQILKEYENEKCGILNQWKKMNSDKLNGLMNKYGNRFLGMDIVENKKKIEPKDEKEIKTDDKKEIKSEPTPEQPSETSEITEDELMEDTMIGAENSPKGIINKIKFLWDDEKARIKEIVKSAHTKGKGGVKALSNILLNNLDDEKDESKKIICKLKNDNKEWGVSQKAMEVVNGDVLVLGLIKESNSNDCFTVASFVDKFIEKCKLNDKKNKKSLTKIISGIVCMNFQEFNKNKKYKTDLQSTLQDNFIITNVDENDNNIILYSDMDSIGVQKNEVTSKKERKDKVKKRKAAIV